MRSEDLKNESIKTIYFGGGTPSILSQNDFRSILDEIANSYVLSEDLETTIECNPDDLNIEYLSFLHSVGFNRLSIGIQSFEDDHLKWMNRSHNSKQASECVINASKIGFDNISIDLIYGIPGMTKELWQKNIEKALSLPIQHISSYCLTIEPRTALAYQVRKGRVDKASENEEVEQYEMLVSLLKAKDFNQYEVSNFSKPDFVSQHNTSYWKGEKYLGFGPSAHSFDGKTRSWNVRNNPKYTKAISLGSREFEVEELSKNDQINEYLMTRLRTIWGVDLNYLNQEFNFDLLNHSKKDIQGLTDEKLISIESNNLKLTASGMLRADRIASDLFVV